MGQHNLDCIPTPTTEIDFTFLLRVIPASIPEKSLERGSGLQIIPSTSFPFLPVLYLQAVTK